MEDVLIQYSASDLMRPNTIGLSPGVTRQLGEEARVEANEDLHAELR